MKNLKAKIYTLGCKVNQYDSGKLASGLVQAGFLLVDKNADIAIINSCAVTKTAMIKSRRMIKLAKKENPKAKIILVGCWPKAVDIREKLAGVDLVIVASDFKELMQQISNFQFPISKQIPNYNDQNNKIITSNERARYFIKVQDGCEQFCTYCIIPYTRGGLKSRGELEIIYEIEKAVEAGYREIVLSGIHLGLYGEKSKLSLRGAPATRQSPDNRNKPEIASLLSVARNDNLTALLKKLIKIKNLGRVRLSSIEITEVTDELIKLMKKSNKICKHLHIPLQSGTDKILKLMNRPYTIKNYELRIKNIRKAVPDIAITTDVIVGFPGETEKDFRDTVKFIKQIKFSRLHVFPFSAHEKTPAAKFPGQVEEKIKARRAALLRGLGIKLAQDYINKLKGRELWVIVEQIKPEIIIGKAEYYFEVEIARKTINNKNLKIGELIKLKQ